MTSKAEMEASWADLKDRLGKDQKLTQVLESLDEALKSADDDQPHQRLKVPYASANTVGSDSDWE